MRKTMRVLCVTLETEYLVMLGLFVAGLLFLASGLTKADILLLDEGHHIGVACHHVAGDFINPSWGHDSPRPNYAVHPPLATYVTALSIVHLGDNPIGWRIPSVIVGAVRGRAGLVDRSARLPRDSGVRARSVVRSHRVRAGRRRPVRLQPSSRSHSS